MTWNQVTLNNLNIISNNLRNLFKIGHIILINGPIGVGKTTLLKNILNEYDVVSPSFLHALYYGDIFFHIDAYTLNEEQFLALSIEDYIDSKCIIIEWGELYQHLITQFNAKIIQINLKYEKNKRYISILY